MIKLPKIGAHMDRSRSILFCLVLSAMIAAAPAYESAWGKDGNSGSGSGSGGNSGKGGGNSGKGKSGEGGAGSSTVGSIVSSLDKPNSETVGRTRDMRTHLLAKKKKRVLSTSELQADFQHAQLALKEAELKFNRALADPKADLRKLEQAIRNAELALSTVGARLAVAAAGK